MHAVWTSQNADNQLMTKLWNVGHVFTLEMQKEAFQWLDQHFLPGK
jgi:hypothetical protein